MTKSGRTQLMKKIVYLSYNSASDYIIVGKAKQELKVSPLEPRPEREQMCGSMFAHLLSAGFLHPCAVLDYRMGSSQWAALPHQSIVKTVPKGMPIAQPNKVIKLPFPGESAVVV